MQDAAKNLGIKINLVEFNIYPDVKAALSAGEVDCFATNGIILLSYMDDSVKVLDERLAPQAYGIVAKKGHNELTQIANDAIRELKASGDMKNIIAKWGLN
jgi:ABC-type amino acid transport substrate-binding protein